MTGKRLLKILLPLIAAPALLVTACWIYVNSAGYRAGVDEKIRAAATGRGLAVVTALDRVSPYGTLHFGSIGISSGKSGPIFLKDCRVKGLPGFLLLGRKDFAISCKSGRQEPNLSRSGYRASKVGEKPSGGRDASVAVEIPDYEIAYRGQRLNGSLKFSYDRGVLTAGFSGAEWGELAVENVDLLKQSLELVLKKVKAAPFLAALRPGLEETAGASISGRVYLAVKGDFAGFLFQEIGLTGVSLRHPLVGAAPFTVKEVTASCSGTVSTNFDSAVVKDCGVGIGKVFLRLSGGYDDGGFRLEAESGSVRPNDLAGLVGGSEMEGFDLEGEIGFKASVLGVLKPDFAITNVKIDGTIGKLVQNSDRLDYLKRDFSYRFTDDKGAQKDVEIGGGNPDYTALESLPRHVIGSVIVSEDAGFFGHKGIEFKEIESAMVDNAINGKPYLRGGSTITQQLVKNLFLGREKNLVRKIREILLALEIEAAIPKWRILGIYMNGIEWGPGVFGIGAASKLYFGKPASELLPHESAYLASIIPNPNRYYVYFARDNLREDWYDRIRDILGKLNYFGYIDDDELAKYKDAKIVYDRWREGAQPPVPPPETGKEGTDREWE